MRNVKMYALFFMIACYNSLSVHFFMISRNQNFEPKQKWKTEKINVYDGVKFKDELKIVLRIKKEELKRNILFYLNKKENLTKIL